ncbi:MAG TPA: GGDEF domain-containing protein, partial [Campylobacterales bacterium]|nr:GGDEF domain-containing protein [Campylobacterales bacterium]
MESIKFHKLLQRQLKKVSPQTLELLESDDAQKLLSLISSAYEGFDEDNYLLERSLEISFNELKLYQLEQKSSYESHLNAMVSAMPDMMFLNNSDGKFLEAFVKENQDLITSQEIVGKFYKDVFP